MREMRHRETSVCAARRGAETAAQSVEAKWRKMAYQIGGGRR